MLRPGRLGDIREAGRSSSVASAAAAVTIAFAAIAAHLGATRDGNGGFPCGLPIVVPSIVVTAMEAFYNEYPASKYCP